MFYDHHLEIPCLATPPDTSLVSPEWLLSLFTPLALKFIIAQKEDA